MVEYANNGGFDCFMAKKKTTKKTTKKSKTPSKAQQQLNQIKAEALKKIVEHNRDYLKLDITIPLGDTALKNVHTNQWLFTNLPAEFDLVNWTVIAKQLNSNVNRWEGYVKNRWYIESCDITVDAGSGKAEMKLGLNAFASSLSKFADDFKSAEEAYKNATTKTKTTKNTTNAVTTGDNTTVKGGEGKYIDDIVKTVVGNETDPLKKAKLIHEHIRSKQTYSYYECTKYNTPESCYKNLSHINCADMSRLTASMMRSAGIDCYVVHSTCHFYTVLKINGNLYCSDNASSSSSGREFNYYWQGSSCHSGSTVAFRGTSSYYANCGKVPSC